MALLTGYLSFNRDHVIVIDLQLKESNVFTFSQKADICGLELRHLNSALNDMPKLENFYLDIL